MNDVLKAGGREVGFLVLPEAHDPPTGLLQLLGCAGVPCAVLGDLSCPVLRVTVRSPIVIGTTMPEAPIDEDSYPCAPKHHVGPDASCPFRSGIDPVP